MKKILMLLLVCTLVFSLTLTMTSCDLLNKWFGDETPSGDGTIGGDETPGDDTPGNENGGVGSDMFDGSNGNNGIELPIIGVNSTDMTIPPEGSETEGETPDAE